MPDAVAVPADHPEMRFAEPSESTVPLTLLTAEAFDAWRLAQDPGARNWAEANGFEARLGQVLVFPSDEGLVVSPSQIMWLWYTAPRSNQHTAGKNISTLAEL